MKRKKDLLLLEVDEVRHCDVRGRSGALGSNFSVSLHTRWGAVLIGRSVCRLYPRLLHHDLKTCSRKTKQVSKNTFKTISRKSQFPFVLLNFTFPIFPSLCCSVRKHDSSLIIIIINKKYDKTYTLTLLFLVSFITSHHRLKRCGLKRSYLFFSVCISFCWAWKNEETAKNSKEANGMGTQPRSRLSREAQENTLAHKQNLFKWNGYIYLHCSQKNHSPMAF